MSGARRGAVGIGVIAALVILQVVIVVAVVAGARDQDMTTQRLDSSRALYAADTGIHMALRELAGNSDGDGDGAIGSISSDGNSGNDPALSQARVVVTKSTTGTVSTVTAVGRSGGARRTITTAVTVIPAMARRVSYGSWPDSTPKYRIWDGSVWGAEQDTVSFGAKQYMIVARRCPTRAEVIIACDLQNSELKAAVETGTPWGNLIQLTGDCGSNNTRPYYIAYEQLSGRALVAYRSGNSATIYYRIWDGTSWSAQSSTSSPLSGNPTYIKLIPKPGSNEILLCVLDSNNDIAAMVWDGSAFGNKITVDTTAASTTNDCVDAAYESLTGHAVVMWGKSGNTSPQYRVWTGSAWQAVASAPSVGAAPQWVRIAANPVSNVLLAGVLDSSSHLNVQLWDGSAWGAALQVEASAPTTSSRCFDVAFEGLGGQGLVTYVHSGTSAVKYRSCVGTVWSAESTGPALPGVPFQVQNSPTAGAQEILTFANCSGGQNKLDFMRWDGSVYGSLQEVLTSNLSGGSGPEAFMVVGESTTAASGTTVRGWTDAAPQ
jgi:hypothetical protein